MQPLKGWPLNLTKLKDRKPIMKVLNLPKGHGKTLKSIISANKEWLTIVAPSNKRAKEIERQAKDMDKLIPEPISWMKFIEDGFLIDTNGYIIDDIDLCLMNLTFKDIDMITLRED